jgi:hypothetical protein
MINKEKRFNPALILSRAARNPYVKAKWQKFQLRKFQLTINHYKNTVSLLKNRFVMCKNSLQFVLIVISLVTTTYF